MKQSRPITRTKISSLLDPTKKFPKPPFRNQKQPWPGLAGKMQPRPDHGEASYRGSGRLAGRKALVTGGGFRDGACRRNFLRAGSWSDVAISYFPS